MPARYERLFRLLVGAFPSDFRAEFGDDMQLSLREGLAACPTRVSRWRYAARVCVDLTTHGLVERLSSWRDRFPRHGNSSDPRSNTWLTMHEIRYAFRSLRRRPGLVAAITLTLALGIGANTAVFSLIDSVLLRPLPIADPERAVAIYQAYNATSPYGRVAYPVFRDLQQRTRTLSSLAGHNTVDASVVVGRQASQLTVAAVSGNYFSVLGLRPAAGRLIVPQDDDAAAAKVVVLSDAIWASHFNRSPAAIGATITFGEHVYAIVGVAPADFRGTSLAESPALWVPLTKITQLGVGGLYDSRLDVMTTFAFGWVGLIGRLSDGATLTSAQRELEQLLVAAHADHQQGKALGEVRQHVSVLPAIDAAALADRDNLRRFVLLLLGVVGLTMLIACVNVANLLMARSHERAREIGVRTALGAGRARIAMQLLLESVMLAAAGALAGLVVAAGTLRLLTGFSLPGGIDLASVPLRLDVRVLLFTAGLGIGTALVFGLLPAVRASRVDLATMLRGHGRASRAGPRAALVAVQVAVSIVLLIGAGLFARSLRAGLTTDLGFDPTTLAAISVDPGLNGYDAARTRQFFAAATEAARRIPGVEAAAATTLVPLDRLTEMSFTPEGASRDDRIQAGLVSVSADYFRTLGLDLTHGRSIRSDDVTNPQLGAVPRPVVLNRSAADLMWMGEDPLGREIKLLGSIPLVVVGVVQDTKYESVRDAGLPVVFVPLRTDRGVSIVVRSRAPASVLPALRAALAAIDPNLPLRNARLVETQLATVLMPQRFGTMLFGVFAFIALCVAALGIYAVSAYTVVQRTHELGIRIALGAQRGDVLRAVMSRTMLAAAVGVVAGLATALAAARFASPFLYEVKADDSLSYLAAALALGVTAMAASLVPARRAARVNPIVALQTDQ